MSATMTLTMPQTPSSLTTTTHCCPNCGFADPSPTPQLVSTQAELVAARKRIADLEAQVLQLNQKAAAAIDRWADYEDELSRLRAAQSPTFTHPSSVSTPLTPKDQSGLQQPQHHQQQPPAQPSPTRGGFNRISALLAPRKSTPNLRTNMPLSPPSPAPEVEDLLEALNREQSLRKAAEGRLSKTSQEVEELSAALFEEANEMVANERRARAKLEERVEILEKREVDKKRRLDRLESAMETIQKARALLETEWDNEKVELVSPLPTSEPDEFVS